MAKKPVRVKRYKNTFSSRNQTKKHVANIAVVVVLAVIFGGGFLFAKPVLDAASSFWYNVIKNPSNVDSSSMQQPVEDDGTVQPIQTPPPVLNPLQTNSKWQFVNIAEVATVEAATAKAKQLASEGVTYAIIKLKDTTGNVYYNSSIELAKVAVATTPIDAQNIAKAFSDNGVTPCAYISAFQDSIAAYSGRDMAVKYGNDEYIWLDTSAELGGKPWLNPYSTGSQDYVVGMADELYKMGFNQIIVDKLQFPSGYGTNLCGYGDTQGKSKATAIAETANRLTQAATDNNGYVWIMVPAEALSGSNLIGYEESPFNIGIKNMVVKITLSRTEDGTVVPAGNTTAQMLADFSTKAVQNSTEYMAIYVADNVLDTAVSGAFYDAVTDTYTQKIW